MQMRKQLEMENKLQVWSDKVYWQVADHPAKGDPERLVSSRSTQLGKEDFCIGCHLAMGAGGMCAEETRTKQAYLSKHDR